MVCPRHGSHVKVWEQLWGVNSHLTMSLGLHSDLQACAGSTVINTTMLLSPRDFQSQYIICNNNDTT